jgi:polyphosphate kinase
MTAIDMDGAENPMTQDNAVTDTVLPEAPAAEAAEGARSITHAVADLATPTRQGRRPRHDPEAVRRAFESGDYPYATRLTEKEYMQRIMPLQVELLKAQAWIKASNERIAVLFEGRDAAGKGGTIKRFMEHLNPRGARIVALEKPTEQERSQWYFQRYVSHLPSGGEIVFFDRSWYNRAGVERVMGFCSAGDYLEFMRQAPELERMLVRSGLRLFKFWFSVTRDEQARRFQARGDRSAEAVEAVADRQGEPRQVGRLHRGEGGDVLLHRHRRRALDHREVERQAPRADRGDAPLPAQPAL